MRAQLGNGIRCIYAAVGASAGRIGEVVGMLQGSAAVLDPAITVVTVYGSFDVILDHFSRLFELFTHPTRAVWCILLGLHPQWMLIGVCDPMVCPIHSRRQP